MAKDFARAFYKSKAWQDCRAAYIAERRLIDGGMCEVCREQPGYIVHHKINLSPENIRDPEVALNFDNLEFDCKSCHDKWEGHGVGTQGSPVICAFDAAGDVIGILPPYERHRI